MFEMPKFWVRSKSFLSILLWPVSLIYIFLSYCRNFFIRPYSSSIPIICIGNATLGGAGKTPVALSLGSFLKKSNIEIAYLSRGYRGSQKGPLKINLDVHRFSAVGDEPLLLARVASTWISCNRPHGVKAIEEDKKNPVQCILMDDGYQNPSVYKDINLLVIDGKGAFGNKFIFPAGPLREDLEKSLNRADAFIVLGEPRSCLQGILKDRDKPIFYGQLKPTDPINKKNQKVLAFAGIANPGKFFKTLKESGFSLEDEISFPDHHPFSEKEISHLIEKARSLNCQLITTEKDWVRLIEAQKKYVMPFPVVVRWEDEEAIKSFVSKKLNAFF